MSKIPPERYKEKLLLRKRQLTKKSIIRTRKRQAGMKLIVRESRNKTPVVVPPETFLLHTMKMQGEGEEKAQGKCWMSRGERFSSKRKQKC